MKVSQLSLNSRKKTGENKFVPLKTNHVGWYRYAGKYRFIKKRLRQKGKIYFV